jgi:phenylacetate-CoA ligase
MGRELRLITEFAGRTPAIAVKVMPLISPGLWERMGERLALSSFHNTAEKVPAYRDFLSEHGLENHRQVKTIADFKEMVPVMDKESYIRRYPLDQRSIEKMPKTVAFTTSGGTTGHPTLIGYGIAELKFSMNVWFYYLLGDYLSQRVLFINSLAQGTWTGTVMLNSVCDELAKDPKRDFSVATLGLNAEPAVSLIDTVGKLYDVIILAGYPSFLRLLYYEGVKRKLDWNAHKVVLMCLGEPAANLKDFFVRNYKVNPHFELFNIYGATEGGTAMSTPLCNLVEELYGQNPTYFGIDGTASFFQYCPAVVYYEELDGELVMTRDASSTMMPLIRYKISDAVKLYTYGEMESIWRDHFRIDPAAALKEGGFAGQTTKWPFLAFRGRSDQAVNVLGTKIYPDELTYALNLAEDTQINSFSFGVEEGAERRFLIYLEFFPGVSIPPSELQEVTKRYHDRVVENLPKVNLDYGHDYRYTPAIADPIVKICAYGEGPFKDADKRIKPKYLFDTAKGNGS